MPASQICGRSLAAACCLLIACSAQKQGTEPGSGGGGSAGTQSPGEMAGSGGRSAGGRSTGGGGKGGTAGRPSVEPAGSAGDAEGGHDDNAGAGAGAGAGGADAAEAGAAGTTREVPPDAVCDIDGGSCVSNPTSPCESPSVTCSVKSDHASCEFDTHDGFSATVACGATVSVDTACCGGCGCVKVEVYYDGKYCWQGIPDCPLPNYSGKLLLPRRP